MEQIFDVAVIGGGASGMTAAISAKRTAPQKMVVVLEALSRVGKKLLTTGNGQCNLSNSGVLDNRYHGSSDFALTTLKNAQNRVNYLFDSLSVELFEDQRGRVYPYSRQASAVLDALRFEMEKTGVEVICDCVVLDVSKKGSKFIIKTKTDTLYAKSVVLATGGKAAANLAETGYNIAKSFGHKITPLSPAIVQLKTDTQRIKALKGIKVDATLSVKRQGKILARYTDELLFTEYGISGPAVMQISRDAQKGDVAVIDLCPDIPYQTVCDILFERRKKLEERPVLEFLNGFLNKRVGQTLCKEFDRPSVKALTDADIKKLANSVKEFCVEIISKKGFDSAQVTAGGVETRDVSFNFESKLCKGLYLTGEILNVDGDCGGFNLLFAWISGLTAGENAVK
ncbi:MAG: aminoacetone oxidase family FAD-binding enzyme [Clostridia bacterium]|nr:aminoacetone oxidase family FAD-binding enzyme [Clostridia bacterium]